MERNIRKRLSIWALIVAAVLTIPLFAQWPWTWHDFLFGAVMFFGSASIYEFATRRMKSSTYRIITGAAVFLVLATIWITLATG